MTDTLKPRTVDQNAPKRWAKEGFEILKRSWTTLLPLSLITGFGFSYLIEQNFFIGFTVAMTFSGILQNIMLFIGEEAARGNQVNTKTITEGFKAYASAPNNVMLKQLMVRFSITGCVCLILFIITVFSEPSKPENVENLSSIGYLFELSSHLVTLFIWSWCFQGGGNFSFSSILVRNFGINWDMADMLNTEGKQKNLHCWGKITLIFFIPMFIIITFPIFIFLWQIFWVAYIVAAYRDIFEHENGLKEKQEQEEGGLVYGKMLEA